MLLFSSAVEFSSAAFQDAATCFTLTYFDTIKLLQYFRHFHAAKPGKIFTASKEVSAKGELLTYGIYRSAITYSPFE